MKCPKKWFAYRGKCYRVNMKQSDYYHAKLWCEEHKAKLISVNNAAENRFMWRICHNDPDPLNFPKNSTRATCWLGMKEKPGTGDVSTPQELQQWIWEDGSTTKGNLYSNWASRPGMGDGSGDGNKYFEPNNEKTRRTPAGDDVRHAIINQLEGGMSGKWYDKPAAFRAHAVCEKVAAP